MYKVPKEVGESKGESKEVKVDFNKELKPDSSQAEFMKVEGNALAISGPGGGKTTAMGFRGRYMIESLGIDPDSIRGLNFSVSANNSLQDVLPMVEMSTMHALAYRVICTYRHVRRLRILDTPVILKKMYPYLSEWDIKQRGGDIEFDKVLIPDAPGLNAEYEAFKDKEEALDFADLLLQLYDLLKRGIALEIIGKRHLLVDEFQDICHLMYSIIVLMESTTVSAIGDPFQSMYSWRGSYPDIFDDFRRDFNPTEVQLKWIHRSGQGIVDAYEKLYPRGLKSVVGGGGKVSVYRGRGPLGEVDLLTELVKPGDTVLARTNKQLRLVFDTLRIPCKYVFGHRRLFNGVKGDVKGKPPYLTLMTLNEAKGRTLGNVFIIGVDEGLVPHSLSTNMEEEKHLLYVGMSRPKDGDLYLMFQERPSRFLHCLRTYYKGG